jgi:methyltransferase (TIGR00027 family)
MLNSVKAVAYSVSDLARAKQWYGEILGKAPIFDSPIVVMFAVGDAMLSLVAAADAAPRNDLQPIVYWDVDDIEAAHRRLLDAGAAPRSDIMTTALKSRAATVTDPFGNVIGIATKPGTAHAKSLADQPSDSAMGVALFRALAARDEREEIRGQDFLAEKFLPREYQAMLDNPAAREWIKGKAPGSYEFFLARTAFFDGVVREALRDNLPQIVLLGAGYDSRPYRFRDLLRETRIFELDIASTQQRKRQLLERAGVAIPPSVAFVGVDFARDNLRDVLFAAGFDRSRRTLFEWEGVMYYLTAEAVDQTLALVRSCSPTGSVLCFDYLADAPDMLHRYGVAESQALMRDTYHAEPLQFRIAEGTIAAFLAERGYSILEHLATSGMEKKYLTLRSGEPAGKALACFALVKAVTGGPDR